MAANSSSTANASTTFSTATNSSTSTSSSSSATSSSIRQSHKRTFSDSDSSSRTERHLCSFSHLWIIKYEVIVMLIKIYAKTRQAIKQKYSLSTTLKRNCLASNFMELSMVSELKLIHFIFSFLLLANFVFEE